ncbi:SDR family NAD(P)-dependent oxidoreductase [Leifsonia naganoensis]|uniref:NAD(P)-dependent dehydrogenase (Short-subunit alcohol dehydrogenase family) n=1 Tax=Leifsonia naganoensis TaxID=150025 RepID=A0A853DUU9_9MICO|nr:SDR family oxidoreductase [Leifsonia naganoensis]NYK09565.1 NAD(P)-dependent dehydrogenase (short-subunit alcohol dehydrogenase family) [Leifsonia naganoensis]
MTAARTIVITGAASGIGRATAARFAAPGARLWLVDVDGDGLHATAALAEESGADVVELTGSVDDELLWETVRNGTRDGVHAVVNNAYTATVLPAADQTPEDWRRQLGVNLVGPYLAIRALAPALLQVGGSIVNVASVHAHIGIPGYSAYASSKGGLLALTRQQAVELAPGIRVNAVVPGPIRTAVWDDSTQDEIDVSARATALLRLGRADEVAAAIAFLCSDEASFITGAELAVDGGWLVKKESA